MKPYWAACLAAVGIAVALVGVCAATLPDARALSEREMKRIIGAGINNCDRVGHAHDEGQCDATPRYPCSLLCNRCEGKAFADCSKFTCWNCAGGGKLRECFASGGKGCTEFSGAAGCGMEMSAQCNWSGLGFCECPSSLIEQGPCPRKHCQ
jgi:hypothetical protein